MLDQNDELAWNAKLDAFRVTSDFSDLLKIISCYYEMYSRTSEFLGPFLAKQKGSTFFIPPEKDDIKSALGKERPFINFIARSAFVEAVIQFVTKTKGKKTLITPDASTHHSAQLPNGTFEITQILKDKPILKDGKVDRRPSPILHRIDIFGAEAPIYVENLRIPPEQIKFIIVRPKLGKLGTASVTRWEVLFYKKPHGYLVEHVDSNLNPRWSGIY